MVGETIDTALITRKAEESGWSRITRTIGSFDVLIVAVIVGAVVSFAQGNVQFLAGTIAIYALFATATNMLVGWLGVMTFGAAAYFGAGAYFVAILREVEMSPLLLVALAGIVGAILAAVFSVLTVRINGIALTMLTLVFGQILYQLLFSIRELGGDDGIAPVPSGELFGLRLARPEHFWIYAIIVVAVCLFLIRVIYRSSFGRSIIAIHDDPVRADALGLPIKATRIKVFIIVGFFSAIAGALLTQQQGIATSESLNWMLSGEVLIMCLIGGSASYWGPTIGAVVFLLLDTQLFKGISYSSLFIGVILLAVVMVFRAGIVGLPDQILGWIRARRDNRTEARR